MSGAVHDLSHRLVLAGSLRIQIHIYLFARGSEALHLLREAIRSGIHFFLTLLKTDTLTDIDFRYISCLIISFLLGIVNVLALLGSIYE